MRPLDLGLGILRVLIGLLFAGHGARKLLGWFGGSGLNGTAGWVEGLGLGEFLGGLFLALGLATPLAVLPLRATQGWPSFGSTRPRGCGSSRAALNTTWSLSL